jgi:hypothetical protein
MFKDEHILLMHTSSFIQADKFGPTLHLVHKMLHAINMLEIGVDSEDFFFLILSNIKAFDKFVRIIIFLEIDNTLDIHLRPITDNNSSYNID